MSIYGGHDDILCDILIDRATQFPETLAEPLIEEPASSLDGLYCAKNNVQTPFLEVLFDTHVSVI